MRKASWFHLGLKGVGFLGDCTQVHVSFGLAAELGLQASLVLNSGGGLGKW